MSRGPNKTLPVPQLSAKPRACSYRDQMLQFPVQYIVLINYLHACSFHLVPLHFPSFFIANTASFHFVSMLRSFLFSPCLVPLIQSNDFFKFFRPTFLLSNFHFRNMLFSLNFKPMVYQKLFEFIILHII